MVRFRCKNTISYGGRSSAGPSKGGALKISRIGKLQTHYEADKRVFKETLQKHVDTFFFHRSVPASCFPSASARAASALTRVGCQVRACLSSSEGSRVAHRPSPREGRLGKRRGASWEIAKRVLHDDIEFTLLLW